MPVPRSDTYHKAGCNLANVNRTPLARHSKAPRVVRAQRCERGSTMARNENGHFVHQIQRQTFKHLKRRHPKHTAKHLARAADMPVGAAIKAVQRKSIPLKHCLALAWTWGPDFLVTLFQSRDKTLAQARRIYNETQEAPED